MKIKAKYMDYTEVMSLPRPKYVSPRKPSLLLATVIRFASIPDFRAVRFSYESSGMERAGKGPWLILMNHSSFLDFQIASRILYPRRYNIVCTSDGFIGKERLMRFLGCIPTHKFVPDITTINDIRYALHENGTSVLMFPESSYSFDGTTTPLPRKLGVLLKLMKVPVVMITTYGSFTRDPLYNNLQKRKVKVNAKVECLLTPEEIESRGVDELDALLDKSFALDYFKWQADNQVRTDEPFIADGLDRILYKCSECGAEGSMEGKGLQLKCNACGCTYTMDPLGRMNALHGRTRFPHIPDWYAWERSKVREDIVEGRYSLDTDVRIAMAVDYKALYFVGEGHLHHDVNGFVLDGCDGKLHYVQSPTACYSLYSDYFWYEIGDVICIGDKDCLYYCFPERKGIVARTRMAVEEIFKLHRSLRGCKSHPEPEG